MANIANTTKFEKRFEEIENEDGTISNERVVDTVFDLTKEELNSDDRINNLKNTVKESLDFYVNKEGITAGLYRTYKEIYQKANPKMSSEQIKREFDKEYDILKSFSKAEMN